MKRKAGIAPYFFGVVLIAVAGVMIWGALNRQWVYDFWRGLDYEPTGEMARIRDDLKLTERGKFLFKAARASLSSRTEFNEKCRTALNEEVAVLGCYTNDDIYVYNIETAELDGIRELTTAHELLHVVWARMSEAERVELADELKEVYRQNQEVLQEEIGNYAESERQEELFVRAGTEVADLPAELERVYGEIFTEQDAVVAFYDKYIAVFRAMEAEMETLEAEMKEIQSAIETMTAEYEAKVAELNVRIESFNACAGRAGCFTSQSEFNAKRNALVAEREALEVVRVKIGELVNEYNERVEKYNADVTRTEELNQAINSASEVEGL